MLVLRASFITERRVVARFADILANASPARCLRL